MRLQRFLVMLLVLCLLLGGMSTVAMAGEGGKVHIKIHDMPQDDDPDSAWESWEYRKAKVEAQFPDYEIEWVRFAPGTDYRQQYDQLLIAGEEPTIAHTFPYVDVQTRAKNGTIADLSEFYEGWDLKEQGLVTDIFDEAINVDGKWYAIPWGPYLSGIAYNASVMEEGGVSRDVEKPKTWTEFAEMAASITDVNVPRFGYLLLGSDYNAWTFTPWVWSAGGEMVRPNGDGTWAIAFNEEPGVDAAMFMNELIWKYKATQTDVLESYDDMQNHFRAGQAAFGWTSPTGFSKDDLERYDQSQENIGFFPLPGKDEGGRVVGFAGGEVWTMSPNATPEQRQAGWEIIQYMSYDEDYLVDSWEFDNSLGRLDDRIPVRNDLVEKKFSMATEWPDHWAAEFAAVMEVALPEPYCPNWNQLKDEIVKPLQTIYLKEGITREEVQQLLDDCANTLYEKYPESFVKPS